MLFYSLVQLALDVQVFDDRFDDQIAVFQFGQVVFEVSNPDQRPASGVKKAAGFAFLPLPVRRAQFGRALLSIRASVLLSVLQG